MDGLLSFQGRCRQKTEKGQHGIAQHWIKCNRQFDKPYFSAHRVRVTYEYGSCIWISVRTGMYTCDKIPSQNGGDSLSLFGIWPWIWEHILLALLPVHGRTFNGIAFYQALCAQHQCWCIRVAEIASVTVRHNDFVAMGSKRHIIWLLQMAWRRTANKL